MRNQVKNETRDQIKTINEQFRQYFGPDGPGGREIITAFIDEFKELSDRSPDNDPTNIKYHLPFIEEHLKKTLSDSVSISEDGYISMGFGKDEVFGFEEDREKLKHKPVPVVWVVYLIRGIAGRYAFVDPEIYFLKHARPMPGEYHGGFLINKYDWNREGWDREVGPFELYEHPASGAPPIPFFSNVLKRIDMEELVGHAIRTIENENI